jgi:2-oxoglutarate ferredoxin oxidoreductase subunit gamma
LKFEGRVKPGGIVFLNKNLVDITPKRSDIQVVEVPVNAIANRLGNVRGANMVMIGAFARLTGVVSLKSVVDSVKEVFQAKGAKVHKMNTLALEEGASFIKT